MDELYYKIYRTRRPGDPLTIVCLQSFDERDYDQDRFWRDESGDHLVFDSEKEAAEWLNKNIKPEKIDPEYRVTPFRREDYLK